MTRSELIPGPCRRNSQHKPPYALVQLDQRKYSTPGKVYDVDLELVVPVNHNNLDLGNFMASLSLVDAAGQHVVTESRPVRPPPCLWTRRNRPGDR